jgi:hypothetical protein
MPWQSQENIIPNFTMHKELHFSSIMINGTILDIFAIPKILTCDRRLWQRCCCGGSDGGNHFSFILATHVC